MKFPDEYSEDDKVRWLGFVMKFQQVTVPIMAKGMEDTVFYVYNRLTSLNEVGGHPEEKEITFENVFTGETVVVTKHGDALRLPLHSLFSNFPVAMIINAR
jgi:(1->4)-alpha-D-glucan 1-alpha-D-glucosylmutase